MSKTYAVIEGDQVINVIAANSLKIAKEATGSECIETNGEPWMGWSRIDGVWINPEPIIDEA